MMNTITEVLQQLKNNNVIGLPTETVYGLAARISSEKAIDKIFSTKERPFFDPLIVHIHSISQAKECTTDWNEDCEKLANTFWPGPLTLILPKNKDLISDKITSGLTSVGLRMPNHKDALELIKSLGEPVAAPSANKFKKTSPTTAEHVKSSFPNISILDGGPCEIGIESTIVGFENGSPVIYRPGMISQKELSECLNREVKIKESPVAPGHLKHHYMPNTPIIVCNENDFSLKEIPQELKENMKKWELPKSASLAARVLYSKFRELDTPDTSAIVISVNESQLKDDLFSGILNRLSKAASYWLSK